MLSLHEQQNINIHIYIYIKNKLNELKGVVNDSIPSCDPVVRKLKQLNKNSNKKRLLKFQTLNKVLTFQTKSKYSA